MSPIYRPRGPAFHFFYFGVCANLSAYRFNQNPGNELMTDGGHQVAFRIKISETHDFRDLPRDTGTYKREVEDGIVHTFEVKDGKVVKHDAVNREGKPLGTSRLHIDAWGSGSPDRRTCYFCTSGGDTWGGGGSESHSCWVSPCEM